VTIREEIERFLAQHAARSRYTAKAYRCALGHFKDFLGESGIDVDGSPGQLTLPMLRDYSIWLGRLTYSTETGAPERPLAMPTRRNYIVAALGLYKQLAMDGRLDGVAYSDFLAMSAALSQATKYTPEPLERKLPSDEIVQIFLDAVRAEPDLSGMRVRKARRQHMIWLRDRAMILALYSTGMRVGELARLTRGDLDYDDQGAWVTGKGNRTRFVRFSHEAWDALMCYLEARRDEVLNGSIAKRPLFARHDRRAGDFRVVPLATRGVEEIVAARAREAGVLERFHLTPHSFRHYFATRFLRHTGNLALTQDVLGHASPTTTRVYAKTSKEEHIEAHESLFDTE
jgi:site-specific recombinase XerD